VSIRFYRPCEELRGVVARIYAHASGPTAPGDRRWLIVPDGDVKLILPLAGAIRCQIGTTAHLHRESRLIVSGMRTLPGELSFPDGVDAIGIIIRPEGAYRLLGSPHHRITNATFDGEEILDARARHLQGELMRIPREEDRVAHLQARLCQWLRAHEERDLAFEGAVTRLKQSEGRIRIETVAHHAGWSRRHLERRFLDRIGVEPKELANVLRFHAVYKRMRRTAQGHYAALIQDHYFDQSHFLKAFKQYTGVTPRAYSATSDYGFIYIPD
jgi:AraC-like DNA-binding protein